MPPPSPRYSRPQAGGIADTQVIAHFALTKSSRGQYVSTSGRRRSRAFRTQRDVNTFGVCRFYDIVDVPDPSYVGPEIGRGHNAELASLMVGTWLFRTFDGAEMRLTLLTLRS